MTLDGHNTPTRQSFATLLAQARIGAVHLTDQHDVVDANAGQWNGCAPNVAPIFWMILGGHARTMVDHAENTRSFLHNSSSCWFVVAMLRHLVTGSQVSWNSPVTANRSQELAQTNVSRLAYDMQGLLGGSNMAFAVTRMIFRAGWAHTDSWLHGMIILQSVCSWHSIRPHNSDVLLFARPDLIFSHGIDVSVLYRAHRFIAYMAHETAKNGQGNDPSEVFLLTSVGVWLEIITACSPHVVVQGKDLRLCDHEILTLGATLGVPYYFVRPGLKIRFHRMQGCMGSSCASAINRPVGGFARAPANGPVQGALDLTKQARCFWPLVEQSAPLPLSLQNKSMVRAKSGFFEMQLCTELAAMPLQLGRVQFYPANLSL